MKTVQLNDAGYTADGKWRLVVVEPTPEMIAEMALNPAHDARFNEDFASQYAAAIAACPAPDLPDVDIDAMQRELAELREWKAKVETQKPAACEAAISNGDGAHSRHLLEMPLRAWQEPVEGCRIKYFYALPADQSAAVRTLERLGYTYCGGEIWKSPLGKKPDFDLLKQKDARIEELTEQLADTQDKLEKMFASASNISESAMTLITQRDELRIRVAELEKDAARYRWLSQYITPESVAECTAPLGTLDVFIGQTFIDENSGLYGSISISGKNLDAAIDAARGGV